MNNSNFKCNTPVVLIIFNRPIETEITIKAISIVKPNILFVISDGARSSIKDEKEKVDACRNLIKLVDWDCEIVKVFSDSNLGCMRRIVTGLNFVFNKVDKAIIIEDDCVPSINFFRFLEWGLNEFQKDESIGMVCGSNLISHKYSIDFRNGFSELMNPWGWGSWRRVWTKSYQFYTIKEIKKDMIDISNQMKLNWWKKIYWNEVFKYYSYSGTTWDVPLQFIFFKYRLLSVYPKNNLIKNIGFSGYGTHTNINEPMYVKQNIPDDNIDLMQIQPDFSKSVSKDRDNLIAQEIWHYNWLSAIRMRITNILRLLR